MKKILLFSFVIGTIATASAQSSYLGFSSGLHNYTGMIGVGADIGLHEQFALRAGLGIGGWGKKFTGGILFKTNVDSNWKVGLGYSTASGIKDLQTELEVNGGTTQTVTLDLYRQATFNITMVRMFTLKNEDAITLEFGYALAAGSSKFYSTKDGSTLSELGEQVVRIMRPDGLVFGVGYMINLTN